LSSTGITATTARAFAAQLATIWLIPCCLQHTAQLRDDESGKGLMRTTRNIENTNLERVREMLGLGMSIRATAEALGISKSAAHRLKQKLDQEKQS
jgi:DNA invertase Pin-like site-specific DNA recombinase